jgi:TRAP transporter TAXI family solute receptor
MCRKKWVRFCLVFLVFILTILFGQNDSLGVERKTLTWGSTSTTSGAFTFFAVVAKMLNDTIPEINVSVRSTEASVHNARLFEKGEIDIGGIDTRTAWLALQGKGPFEGKPVPDLRLLHVITSNNALQFLVSESSGIKGIYGLEGKPFTPGMLGSSTEQLSTEIFRTLGIRPKFRHSNYADAIEGMKNEIVVGFAKAAAPDSSI